jgi:hypothetical protein
MTDDKCACEESLRLRERVRNLLRGHLRILQDWMFGGASCRDIANEVLAADDRLAQAEETTVEEPVKPGFCKPNNCPDCDSARERGKAEVALYRPKVGDRVRLVASPEYRPGAWPIGRVYELVSQKQVESSVWSEIREEGERVFCVLNATFLPVAEKPEPPASEPSGKPGVNELFDLWWERVGTSARVSPRCTFEGGFDTGWASRDAEVAELKRELLDLNKYGREQTTRSVEAEVEVAELRRKLADETRKAEMHWNAYCGVEARLKASQERERIIQHHRELACQELEAERAAHGATKAEHDSWRRVAERLQGELNDARKARPMPSREQIAALVRDFCGRSGDAANRILALFGAQEEQAQPAQHCFSPECVLPEGHSGLHEPAPAGPDNTQRLAQGIVDAIGDLPGNPAAAERTLFAALNGIDNTPPDPLPEVLPASARTKYGTPIGGWVRRLSYETDGGFVYESAVGRLPRYALPDQVDWAHWRSQQTDSGSPAADERPWNFDAPPDLEIGQQHELLPNDPENEAFELHPMIYSGLETRVDAQPRWDDKASGAYRVMGMSVAAWRRVAPAQPSLEGMPTTDDIKLAYILKRLDKLEFDGRVTRRLIVEAAGYGAEHVARIELEEKGE